MLLFWVTEYVKMPFCHSTFAISLIHAYQSCSELFPFQILINFMILIILLQWLHISLHLKVRLSFAYRKFEMRDNLNYGIVIFFPFCICVILLFVLEKYWGCFPVGVEKRHVFIRQAGPFFVQWKLNRILKHKQMDSLKSFPSSIVYHLLLIAQSSLCLDPHFLMFSGAKN